ncbi:protease modulator HflC [Desulfopila inferna]|uniref:protease modulator HflC n=1 Tax=Desulfopila inferna TaxID=468528 RepID=UPI001966393E|nr:protease modulator HflC [Desulfopila inferna]MBM9605468.1 protease modulator HflC [Desulfopila inferna]
MKNIAKFLLVGLVLAAIVIIYDGFFILEEGKQAVITQFGAPVASKTEAGLHFKKPFFHQVQLFEKKIQIWDGEPNQVPTNDKTYVYLDVTARWKIADPLQFLRAVKTEARAQSLLSDIIDGTVRDMVNKNDLSEIIRSSDWSEATMTPSNYGLEARPKMGRDKIAARVLEIASKVTPQYGIELNEVMFKRVNYIESVQLRVYDRMISERKRIAAEKRSFGEGQKAEILGQVEREYNEITSEANREALRIKGKADAEATKIYGLAYSKDPEFYSFQRSLEGYAKIIGANTNLVLSADSELYQYVKEVSGNTAE